MIFLLFYVSSLSWWSNEENLSNRKIQRYFVVLHNVVPSMSGSYQVCRDPTKYVGILPSMSGSYQVCLDPVVFYGSLH
jgi:hypothetical protein